MFEPVKYINHMRETIQLDTDKIFIQNSDLRDFKWNSTTKNNKIIGFRKEACTRGITLAIKGTTEECFKIANQLFSLMEKDTLAVQYGTLIMGEYYLKCYVVESSKNEFIRSQGYLNVTLKVTTDMPYWIRETTTTFGYGADSVGTNLDFNRDFPSDYTSNLVGQKLNNTGFVSSNFRIVIYGACEVPGITIAGHLYEVKASVAANEYLTIDSVNKTVTLTHADGTKENCFNLRNKDSYVFEKIPSGLSNVSASGGFKFDVVLLEERSEPKWT